MSDIRCIYHGAPPNFPAMDQHPDAVRYGPITCNGEQFYIDAIGGEPTTDEIAAILNPVVPADPAPASPDDVAARVAATLGVSLNDLKAALSAAS